jgi:hypothetical protein
VRNAWNTVLKAREKRNQEIKIEPSDGALGIVDTGNPRITAKKLVNELLNVLYPCRSDV